MDSFEKSPQISLGLKENFTRTPQVVYSNEVLKLLFEKSVKTPSEIALTSDPEIPPGIP